MKHSTMMAAIVSATLVLFGVGQAFEKLNETVKAKQDNRGNPPADAAPVDVRQGGQEAQAEVPGPNKPFKWSPTVKVISTPNLSVEFLTEGRGKNKRLVMVVRETTLHSSSMENTQSETKEVRVPMTEAQFKKLVAGGNEVLAIEPEVCK